MLMPISKKVGFKALLVVGTLLTVFVFLKVASPPLPENAQTLWLKNVPITITIAKTNQERQRGLGGQASLPPNHGMFFVFDHDDYHSFWMENMHFAIDILWLDQNLTVVDTKLDVTPESYPTSFTPRSPARYVLEVSAGFSRDHEVTLGDRAHF